MRTFISAIILALAVGAVETATAAEKPAVSPHQEQVYTWLASQLGKVETAMDKTASFASEQVPLFVQEFLMFQMVWNWAMWVILIGMCVVVPISLYFVVQAFRKRDRYGDWGALYLVNCLLLIPFAISFEFLKPALMVTFAPKVYLVTEFIRFFR